MTLRWLHVIESTIIVGHYSFNSPSLSIWMFSNFTVGSSLEFDTVLDWKKQLKGHYPTCSNLPISIDIRKISREKSSSREVRNLRIVKNHLHRTIPYTRGPPSHPLASLEFTLKVFCGSSIVNYKCEFDYFYTFSDCASWNSGEPHWPIKFA